MPISQSLAELGIAPEAARRMRPWLLALTMAVVDLRRAGYSEQQGVDRRFLQQAHGDTTPKPVVPLETPEDQLRAMADLPEKIQLLMLDDAADQLAGGNMMDEMLKAWRAGDSEALAALVFKPMRDRPELLPLYEAIFFKRNRKMASRLQELLGQTKSYFVVVGAGHLVGQGNVVESLRAQGFEVEQVHVLE